MLYVVVLSMGHFRTFRYEKKESHNLLVKIKSIICMNLVNQFKHARPDNTTKNVEVKYTNLNNNNNKTHTIKTEKSQIQVFICARSIYVQTLFSL